MSYHPTAERPCKKASLNGATRFKERFSAGRIFVLKIFIQQQAYAVDTVVQFLFG
jgi:hypothetical protein